MNSMPSQHVVTLYIHPENGPIKPITLNLMDIEIAVHNSRIAMNNYEEERLRQLAARIKKEFPYVDPYSNRNGLVTILARFTNAYQFSGMVLRLAGTIQDSLGAASVDGVKHLNSKVDELVKENSQVKRLLEVEQQAHHTAKEQLIKLNTDYQRQLRDRDLVYDRNTVKIEDLEERLRLKEAENKRVRDDADKVIREYSSLKTQQDLLQDTHREVVETHAALGKAYDELQARFSAYESEIAKLRVEVKNAKRTEEQLRATIEKQQDEISFLEEELRSKPAQSTSARGSDQFDMMLPP